jgi:hypothetical protein
MLNVSTGFVRSPAAEAWTPGLDNEDRLLDDVYASMPKDPTGAVPWWVSAMENPGSPVALPGAVDLHTHDCIHIILGRGLLAQDEAFVIGFNHGRKRVVLTVAAGALPLQRAARLPRHLPVLATEIGVFDLAVEVGRRAGSAPIHQADFRALGNRQIGEIRRMLGVRAGVLRSAYHLERALWPQSSASARL